MIMDIHQTGDHISALQILSRLFHSAGEHLREAALLHPEAPGHKIQTIKNQCVFIQHECFLLVLNQGSRCMYSGIHRAGKDLQR